MSKKLQRPCRAAVIGLGYVGFPLAEALALAGIETIGYDVAAERAVQAEWNLAPHISDTGLFYATSLPEKLVEFGANTYFICVPTPLTDDREPDLDALLSATELVGGMLKEDDIVIYESTVYPGCIEGWCRMKLAESSALLSEQYGLAYSPERINPGDKEHTLANVTKVVAATDVLTRDEVAEIYRLIVPAGVYVAPSIEVAEMAKLVENTQRDVNIAFMNEVATICAERRIDTGDVLDACRTKWNFVPFEPGLVGGHCIAVDPHYLNHASMMPCGMIEEARQLNDRMPSTLSYILRNRAGVKGGTPARLDALVLGLTFKENVTDCRESGALKLCNQLREHGFRVSAFDHLAPVDAGCDLPSDVKRLHNLPLDQEFDVVILAVPHDYFLEIPDVLAALKKPGGVFFDVKRRMPRHLVTHRL